MPRKPKGHDLANGGIEADPAMEKVIAAQARANELKRQVAALRKDRDTLLSEFTDIQNARKIKTFQKGRTKTRSDLVRVTFGDMHGQRMDRKAVECLLADIRTLDPDEVVIGGDMLDCGGWLAKHQPVGFVAYSDYSYQEDVEAANYFLDELQKAAPRADVHYIEGNHEDRVERWVVDQVMASQRDGEFLRSLVSPQTLLRLAERGITYYRRSETHVDGLPRGWIKRGGMFFTHSLSYSKNAARDAATKTAGSVTYFCTHRRDSATVVFPAVGLVDAYNPGCLCIMQPVWRNSDPTNWSQGYGIDFVSPSGQEQRVPIKIWRGQSMAEAMVDRFRGE